MYVRKYVCMHICMYVFMYVFGERGGAYTVRLLAKLLARY